VNRALPAWCLAPEPQTILDAIIDEHPTYYVRSGYWSEGGGVERYRGKNAAALRRYHNRLRDEALARDDAAFHATGKQGGEFAELCRVSPDEVIGAVLKAHAFEAAAEDMLTLQEGDPFPWEWAA
jgi:hypothetical protein